MKKILLIPLLLLLYAALNAQESRVITGLVVEEDTSQPVVQAGVQLLSDRDSTRLEGVVTDLDGRFAVRALPGDYILKITYLGYVTKYINVHQTISREGLNLGTIMLAAESQDLEASVVTAKAPAVTVKADTVVYNAAAYHVAEDADLDELLKKIPGLEVDNAGGVTLHGRKITQLMVNGKRYFGGDVKSGLKNIPAAMVENIKAYDRPTEEARLSGVDDGESEPVLDLSIKKSMMNGWHNNLTIGGGNENRHTARINANKITKKEQQTVVASNHNIVGKASINATSRTQMGTGSSGDVTYTTAGYTFSKDLPKLEMAGHFQYSDGAREQESQGRSQSVQATSTTFGNTNIMRHSVAPVIKGDFSAEWKKDKNFTFFAKAVFQYDENSFWSLNQGRSFNADPYEKDPNPNSWIGFDVPGDPFTDIRVNSTCNTANGFNSKYNGNLTVTAVIRNPKNRRKYVSLRAYTQLYGTDGLQATNYLTRYYRIKANPDSVLVRSNYVDNRMRQSYSFGQVALATPISKKWSAQFILRADYLFVNQDKDYYDLAAVDASWEASEEIGRRALMRGLPSGYRAGFYDLFSAAGTYERWVFPVTVNVFKNTSKTNVVLGVTAREQLSVLHFEGDDIWRNTFDVAPNISFKYRPTKSQQLSLVYRSWVSGVSVGSMLPITNGTNPLYISVGNPYLVSPVVHNANLSYNSSNKARQSSFTTNITYNNTIGLVSTSTVYDPDTGVRTSTPQNINGNWRATASMAFTRTLSDTRYSLTNQMGGEYQNNVSYLYNSKLKKDEVNVLSRLMIKDRFEGCFRNDWLELLLNAGIEYTDESSLLRPEMSQKPISWIAGVATQFSFPWKMRIESDFSTTFQRGYSYVELNKNYYIWNAEISQRIMNGKATLRLGWYDILKAQDNLIRSLNSSSRSITLYNGVASYVMLRFFYRFKL